ncbi:MAG: SpoIIE family protein phosphatase, partial [Gemmatimonadales bacterium]|nr:SpoIIE family protein phosphatase [Gemmatimonadales bacterium]
DDMVRGLGALAGVGLRVWRFDGKRLRPAAGGDPGWTPPVPRAAGLVPTPTGAVWLAPVPGIQGFWIELGTDDEARAAAACLDVMPFVSLVLDGARERAALAEELAGRYEEIDLLYAISEILGHTVSLEDAAQTIVRDVSAVVGARRASIMVFDEPTGTLRAVAARGFTMPGEGVVAVDDECSVAARVFREQRMQLRDPSESADAIGDATTGCGQDRGYLGEAFLSVPISYAAPGGAARCVGVINLTDRIGGDRFTPGDRKLIGAIAHQIGAAIENARLVQLDRRQQRLRRELELAHDLQLRLLPSPTVLQGDAVVAARCVQADSVGGDFYTFSRLGQRRVGVMLGDVSSHGFSAALVMALVMSAAGIHAVASSNPDETLSALLDSLADELATTEMYLTVFYAVLDPDAGRLTYANAGHPHAFRVSREGDTKRLLATAPPLGLASQGTIERAELPWRRDADLLCLWTDGLVDARNADDEPFSEARVLDLIMRHRSEAPDAIVSAVMSEVEAFVSGPRDDRTLLVLRL